MSKLYGFHLIELLIVLSIVGILLVISIPNYSTHLTHERQLETETALMKLAGAMEIFYAQNNTYAGATLAGLGTDELIARGHYRLIIQSATESDFELAAIPQNNAGGKILTLNSTGEWVH